MRELIDRRTILLANLGIGSVGEDAVRLLGTMLVSMVATAAMSRLETLRRRDEAEVDPELMTHVFIDEAHYFLSSHLIEIVNSARKSGISLCFATQLLGNIEDERSRNKIVANAGNLFAFRLGPEDARVLEERLHPLTSQALQELPPFVAAAKTLTSAQARRLYTHEPYRTGRARAKRVRNLSRSTHALHRSVVEEAFSRSFEDRWSARSSVGKTRQPARRRGRR